jgi:hypothetical protein
MIFTFATRIIWYHPRAGCVRWVLQREFHETNFFTAFAIASISAVGVAALTAYTKGNRYRRYQHQRTRQTHARLSQLPVRHGGLARENFRSQLKGNWHSANQLFF